MLQSGDIEEALALLLNRADKETSSRASHSAPSKNDSLSRRLKQTSTKHNNDGFQPRPAGYSHAQPLRPDGKTTRQRRKNMSYGGGSAAIGTRDGSRVTKSKSPRLNRSTPPAISSLVDFPPIGGASRDLPSCSSSLHHSNPTSSNQRSSQKTPVGSVGDQKRSRRITPTLLVPHGETILFSSPMRPRDPHPAFVSSDPSPASEDTRFQRRQSFGEAGNSSNSRSARASSLKLDSQKGQAFSEEELIVEVLSEDDVQFVSLDSVSCRDELDSMAAKYAKAVKSGSVVNIGTWLQQLLRLLTLDSNLDMWKEMKGEVNLEGEGSTMPTQLSSFDNCIYFATKVLEHHKHLLCAFGKETLHILSVNAGLGEMSPGLKSWLQETCAENDQFEEAPSSDCSSVFGVSFDGGRDSKENFPSDKAFNAFRKQRDAFYELYRQWRALADHGRDELIGKKARSILVMSDDFSQAAFTQLFLLQLIKSSTAAHQRAAPGVDESLADSSHQDDTLRQADPTRLRKLTQRFTGPLQYNNSNRSTASAKEHFAGDEDFFHKFILVSDSYCFCEHLTNALVAEIHKLNNPGSLYGNAEDYEAAVTKLRLLAKFLAFVVDQPYRGDRSARTRGCSVLAHPVDVESVLRAALRARHLMLTLPWLLVYLRGVEVGRGEAEGGQEGTVLDLLFSLLRVCQQATALGSMETVLMHLSIAQLVESQSLQQRLQSSTKREVDPTIQEWAGTVQPSTTCIDGVNLVSAKLVRSCCALFDEVHSILVQFSMGRKVPPTPVRKIKPVPVFSLSTFAEEKPKSKEQEQLEDAFLASQPTFVRQLCDVVASRLSANMEALCKEQVIPSAVQGCLQRMADLLRSKLQESKEASADNSAWSLGDLNQNEISSSLALNVSRCVRMANSDLAQLADKYLQKSATHVFEILVQPILSETVRRVMASICVSWARQRLVKWIQTSLAVKVQEQLQKSFEKLKKAVISGQRSLEQFTLCPLTQQLVKQIPLLEEPQSHSSPFAVSRTSRPPVMPTPVPSLAQSPLPQLLASHTPLNKEEEGPIGIDSSPHRPLSSTPQQSTLLELSPIRQEVSLLEDSVLGKREAVEDVNVSSVSTKPSQDCSPKPCQDLPSSTLGQEVVESSLLLSPTTFTQEEGGAGLGPAILPKGSRQRQEMFNSPTANSTSIPAEEAVSPAYHHTHSSTPRREVNCRSRRFMVFDSAPFPVDSAPFPVDSAPCSRHSFSLSAVVDTSVSYQDVPVTKGDDQKHLIQQLKAVLSDLQMGERSSDCTTKGALGTVVDCTVRLLRHFCTRCTIEGIAVPAIMDVSLGPCVAEVTVKLAVELVCRGCTLALDGHVGSVMFDLWRLLKACKVDVPWQDFLQTEKCFSVAKPVVLNEIGCCLGNIVAKSIALSWEVEALWLAVLRFNDNSVFDCYLLAAVAFLNKFFKEAEDNRLNHHRGLSCQKEQEPIVHTSSSVLSGEPPHIHFVRLLCLVSHLVREFPHRDTSGEGELPSNFRLNSSCVAIATELKTIVY